MPGTQQLVSHVGTFADNFPNPQHPKVKIHAEPDTTPSRAICRSQMSLGWGQGRAGGTPVTHHAVLATVCGWVLCWPRAREDGLPAQTLFGRLEGALRSSSDVCAFNQLSKKDPST